MMLRELYQDLIMDHNRHPRNHYAMEDANGWANGFNPLCGDKLTVYLHLDNACIKNISFVGCGCAISQASASLMTEAVLGKSIVEALALFQQVHTKLTIESDEVANITEKWMVLLGVRAFPARVKCATLAWHTLAAALNGKTTAVTE